MMKFFVVALPLISALRFHRAPKLDNDVPASVEDESFDKVETMMDVAKMPTDVNLSELKDRKSANIYVLNLPKRKDRCQCMQSQLEGSPYSLVVQEAVESEKVEEHCPGLLSEHKVQGDGKTWAAIFCANRLVLEEVSKSADKPDFVIIMEDDVSIHPTFLPKLQLLLNDDCLTTAEWDVMAVDTFTGWWDHDTLEDQKSLHRVQFKTCSSTANHLSHVYHSNKHYFGAHVQIIRTSQLDKVLARKPDPVDWWQHFHRQSNVTTIFWQPGLVKQMKQKSWKNRLGETKKRSKKRFDTVPEECQKSVATSDHKKLTKDGMKFKQEQQTFSLDCQQNSDDYAFGF